MISAVLGFHGNQAQICGCEKCGHLFLARNGKYSKRCPYCKSSTWNEHPKTTIAGVPVVIDRTLPPSSFRIDRRETTVDTSYSQE